MSNAGSDILAQAIAQRWLLTVASTGQEAPRHEQAKFLSFDEEGGIWVQSPTGSERVARRWHELRTPLQGQFFDRNGRYTFPTHLIGRRKDYWLTDRVAIDAWLLEAPGEVATIQERKLPRHHLADSKLGIQGKLMVIDRQGVTKVREVPATLVDLSMGGASFLLPVVASLVRAAPRVIPYQPVIQLGLRRVALNGLLIYARATSARSMRVGIEFMTTARQPPQTFEKLEAVLAQLDSGMTWGRGAEAPQVASFDAAIATKPEAGSPELTRQLEHWLRVPPPVVSGD
jgi:hypothetical protein